MNDFKQWYMSKTIWGGLVAIAASVLRLSGVHLGDADQGAIADAAVTLAGAIGGLLAVYGRLTAKGGIGGG